jgi:hypothetical protein
LESLNTQGSIGDFHEDLADLTPDESPREMLCDEPEDLAKEMHRKESEAEEDG